VRAECRGEEPRADLRLGRVEPEEVAARLEPSDSEFVDPETRGDDAWIGRHQWR